jgi:hypothetical protein
MRPCRTGWPGWANFHLLGKRLIWEGFWKLEKWPKCLRQFFTERFSINFDKIRVGLIFGLFFHEIIWSPCCRTSLLTRSKGLVWRGGGQLVEGVARGRLGHRSRRFSCRAAAVVAVTAGTSVGRPHPGGVDHLVVLLQPQDLGAAENAPENGPLRFFYGSNAILRPAYTKHKICVMRPNFCVVRPNFCVVWPNFCVVRPKLCVVRPNFCVVRPNFCVVRHKIEELQFCVIRQILCCRMTRFVSEDKKYLFRVNTPLTKVFCPHLVASPPPQRWHETTRYGFYFVPGV